MADNVKISQLDQITEVADNDILIVNDASTGKTRTTTKANLLSGLTKNITDNGDDVVIKNDVKVNNDLTLDGDLFTTGKLTFGQLHDYANDVSVLGFADSQNAFLQNDDLIPTAGAIRAYLTSVTDAITTSTSQIAQDAISEGSGGGVDSSALNSMIDSAVAVANQSLSTQITSNDNGILALSTQITNLSVSVTDHINATSTAESEMRALISSNDSGVTVLSQRMDALDVSLQTAGLDSDFVTTAISSATDTLTARIDQDSARLSVVSQEVTQLSASLETAGLDSDFVTSAISNATDSLTARIDQDSAALSIVSDKVTVLEASLTEGIDSDLVLQVSGGAINELSARIDQDSARLSVVSEEVTTLTGSLTNAQNDVAANVLAVSGLSARIDQDSARLSVVSQDVTQLTADLSNIDTSGIAANADALSSLTARVNQDSDRLSVVSQDVTQLQADLSNVDLSGVTANADALNVLTARVDQDSDRLVSLSSDVTTLSAAVDSDFASVNNSLQAIVDDQGNATAVWNLDLNVNNHIAGIEFSNDGSTADFTLVADTFKIVNASDNEIQPFTVSGDDVLLSNATVTGALDVTTTEVGVGSMTIKGDVITIRDANSNVRVKLGKLS